MLEKNFAFITSLRILIRLSYEVNEAHREAAEKNVRTLATSWKLCSFFKNKDKVIAVIYGIEQKKFMESQFLKISIIVRDSVRKSEESTPKQHANFSFFGRKLNLWNTLLASCGSLSWPRSGIYFLVFAGNDSCVSHGLSEKASSD